jgi:hypothetical protein
MLEIYCIDTSSLIKLRRDFPQDVFPGVWENIEKLGASGRLIAPTEVLREIERGDDELVSWVRQHRKLFKKPDQAQLMAVREILAAFPVLAQASKETPEADPFVVGLAKAGNDAAGSSLLPDRDRYIVVSEERRRATPQACSRYGIKCITLLDLFRREGWRFRS